MPRIDKRSYRLDEAAREFGCSRRTVERLIERGDLRAFKVGRLTRIHYTQIESFPASQNNSGHTTTDHDKRRR